ncbi:MAG TPA: hypothetical protein VMF91_22970 [Bryobacteraceae bacterium]|nr:hypothetical protein [Bryobacteraceae bacterium]
MSAALMAFAKWLQGTEYAQYISSSDWVYPFVQLTHFTGLSLWIGTDLALDFRLLGLGRKRQTAADLSKSLFAWNWVGFAIAVCGGFSLFASSATKYVINPAFLIKLGILIPCALVVHITNQQKVKMWGAKAEVPGIARCMGLLELVLWLCVVTAAVSIPTFEIFGS